MPCDAVRSVNGPLRGELGENEDILYKRETTAAEKMSAGTNSLEAIAILSQDFQMALRTSALRKETIDLFERI